MDLKFLIPKQALFVTALLKESDIEGWVDLQNSLWEKYPLGYRLMQGNAFDIFVSEDNPGVLEKATTELKALIEKGSNSAEFAKLFENANLYKKWLENEWSVNKNKVLQTLNEIIKIELPKDIFTVSNVQ